MRSANTHRRDRWRGIAGAIIGLASTVGTGVHAETFTLSEASISDIRKAMDAGALSSVELTVLYLNRIEAYDRHGLHLNALVVDNPDVLEEAAQADQARAKGKSIGKLEGIPYTIKDSYKAKGLTVAAGSPAFKSLIANEDAFTVAQIRAEGGVLIGKTNMPPLAAGGMQRGVYGRAESPYNPMYLTAAWNSGSSNGSGTATSASFASFGLGEETVSSGRSPSSNNGLVAYTPSRGVISIRGNWPLFPIKDVVVPMTRSVDDMFALLDVIVADDARTRGDFWRDQKVLKLPAASKVRPASYANLANPDALRGKRIGVPTMYIGKDTTGKPIPIRPSILALWERTAAKLRELGATVVEVDFPLMHNYDMDRPSAQSFVERGLIPADWFMRMRDGKRVGPNIEFEKLNPYSWAQFLADNGDPKLSSWKDVDPATVFPYYPGSVDYRRSGASGRYYGDAKAAILAGVKPFDTLPGFAAALRGVEEIRKVDFEQWLDSNKLDFIAFPANADVGSANADIDDHAYDHATSNGVARSNTNAMLRHMGIPSTSVTMGLMEDTGMPVNVTFAGKAYSDNALLSYAYAFEAATHYRKPPARIKALADERIDYDQTTAIPPSKRTETVAPRVTINAAVSLDGAPSSQAVAISGSASDASGLSAVRVYVNGHKVHEGLSGQWSASVPMWQLRQWMNDGENAFTVTLLAKDKLGNAAASMKALSLPAQ